MRHRFPPIVLDERTRGNENVSTLFEQVICTALESIEKGYLEQNLSGQGYK